MALLDSNAPGALARHPTMTLLCGTRCVFSHACRIVLLEKDVECSIEYVAARDYPAKLGDHNPYLETPTLLDRDLTLYLPAVIIEYLDERFPHPPLMPVDPIMRAKTRLMLARMRRDWLTPMSLLEAVATRSRLRPPVALKRSIRDGLTSLTPLFARQPFFLGHEYTLADAHFSPLLWRLPSLGIELPRQAAALTAYGERMFKRSAFKGSLSAAEQALRPRT